MALPVGVAIVVSVRAGVSPWEYLAELTTESTWEEALIAIGLGALGGAAIKQIAKKLSGKVLIVVGFAFSLFSWYEAIKLSTEMAYGGMSRRQIAHYLAVMTATIILTIAIGRAVRKKAEDGYVRAVPEDQVGTSQPLKPRRTEAGISVFEDVSVDDVLKELPGDRISNTTVTIPKDALPPGTQVIPEADPSLPKVLSDAHRNLVPPEGMSASRFAKLLKKAVGWGS